MIFRLYVLSIMHDSRCIGLLNSCSILFKRAVLTNSFISTPDTNSGTVISGAEIPFKNTIPSVKSKLAVII